MIFDERVLDIVKRIPKGKVSTYKGIARTLDTKAYRAVGQALRRNARPIKIPCHRVVLSSGKVGGYAGKRNSKKKIALLRKDGIVIENGRVDVQRFGWKI